MKTLELRPASPEALSAEHRDNLRKGRVFVAGASGVATRELCELVLVHPQHGGTLSLKAEAVWVGDSGVGLELVNVTEAVKRELDEFVAAPVAEQGGESTDDDESNRPPRHVQERVRALSLRERD
ncbi:MAG TPA: hypothetical protein VGP93_13695, partial [Polyangiaceae bacterium]|nr:hypothetical protein [Polyangiaceae bacterium]